MTGSIERPHHQKLIATRLDDLAALLDESLACFQHDTEQHTYRRLSNFKLFEKNLRQLSSKSHRDNKPSTTSPLTWLLRNWDLVALALLSLTFASYLAFFIASYYTSPTASRVELWAQLQAETRDVYRWLVAKWMHFNNFDEFSGEECALVMPDLLNSVLRPVDNCGMCEDAKHIRRVANISKEEFLAKYAYTGVPVVVTDAIKSWSALRVFNFQFLKELYLNELKSPKKTFESGGRERETASSSSSRLSCQFFPYRTRFRSLVEVLEMGEREMASVPWYVGWSNCNNHASKVLRKHYKRPYFLPDESEMSRLDWIFMGTPGYGAEIHIDDVSNPSWQAQISGVKRWTFKPTAECLLRCPFTLTVDVFPGDIIVFDSNRWFHATLIVGTDISLTIGSEYD